MLDRLINTAANNPQLRAGDMGKYIDSDFGMPSAAVLLINEELEKARADRHFFLEALRQVADLTGPTAAYRARKVARVAIEKCGEKL